MKNRFYQVWPDHISFICPTLHDCAIRESNLRHRYHDSYPLRRVYDNELRLPSDQDTLTLPELLAKVTTNAWTELGKECPADRNDRQPMISSLRRNLQREHLERLMDLVLESNDATAAYKPISNLASMQLRDLKLKIEHSLNTCGDKMDAYTKAHLVNSQQRIERTLNAQYSIGNASAAPQILMLSGQTTGDDEN